MMVVEKGGVLGGGAKLSTGDNMVVHSLRTGY